MTVRLESVASRIACLVLACVFSLLLGFLSIRAALAEVALGEDTQAGYERAVRIEPTNPQNWYILGRYWQYNLEHPDSAAALSAYHTSLSMNPRAADVWLDLATLLESEGKSADAASAFQQAKRSYPISAEVAWRYGNFLLRQGEIAPAFAEFRHAVAVDSVRGTEAFFLCNRVEPNVQKVLDLAIPSNRRVYLDIIRSLASQNRVDDAVVLWRQLPDSRQILQLEDAEPLVEALHEQRRIAEAYNVWLQAAGVAGFSGIQPADSLVWDGGFESGISNLAFAWEYPALSQGVQIVRDSTEKHSGRFSLRLNFDGQSDLDFHNVCHLLAIKPQTHYTLTAWTHTRGLTSDEGVRLELRAQSVVSPNAELTSAALGDQPWSQLEFAWTSPPDTQAATVCLVRNPSAAVDNRIRGEFWIDDVTLRPASSTGAAQQP